MAGIEIKMRVCRINLDQNFSGNSKREILPVNNPPIRLLSSTPCAYIFYSTAAPSTHIKNFLLPFGVLLDRCPLVQHFWLGNTKPLHDFEKMIRLLVIF